MSLGIRSSNQYGKPSSFNEEFFHNIQTEAQAYFLGFLYADGCNSLKYNAICWQIAEYDANIMNLFRKNIKHTGKAHIAKKRAPNQAPIVHLNLHSKIMSAKLNEIGCVPCKSLVLTFPQQKFLSPYLYNHFIRGYFDGNGCICYYPVKENRNLIAIRFKIAGTLSFLTEIHKILSSKLNINFNIYKQGSISLIDIGKYADIIKIHNYLYKDATLFLSRKFNKFKEIFNIKNKIQNEIKEKSNSQNKE